MTLKQPILSLLIFLSVITLASAGAPNITGFTPSSDPTDQVGTGGGFSIVSNQTVTINWYVNGTLKQNDYGTTSTYVNKSSKYQANAYNVSVNISNSNGVSSHMWNWTVINVSAPGIISYYPQSDPTSIIGTAQTFSIISNQTIVNATWYINGTLIKTSAGGDYTITFINSTTPAQTNAYNVTVIVNSSFGTTSRMWNWTVSALKSPSITGYAPATNPTDLNTSSRTFNITVNQTGTINWYVNGSLKQTDTSTVSSYTNSTAPPGIYNVSVNFTGTNGTTSRQWIWTRTTAPAITSYAPTPLTPSDVTANITRIFNVTADRTSNYSWYIDSVLVQVNTSTLTIANYTNSTPTLGIHNVSVITNNTNGTGNMITWAWDVPESTMSSVNVTTNHSTAGRTIKGTNSSLNFSWTDTGNITRVNLTFPAGFNFSALLSANVSSNLGVMTVTLNQATGLVSLYNSTGLNNSAIYVNLTSNVTTPVTAGNYLVSVTTNKMKTVMNGTVYSRDITQPYFVVANNSNFTVGTETFGTLTTTIPLVGTGVSNLTIYAPNISTQTNITVGWGATNVSMLQVNRTGTQTIIYLTTLGTVTNPIIVLSAPNELTSGNLPTGVIGAVVTGLVVIYIFRRRRH